MTRNLIMSVSWVSRLTAPSFFYYQQEITLPLHEPLNCDKIGWAKYYSLVVMNKANELALVALRFFANAQNDWINT
jgi:hypothetical protein